MVVILCEEANALAFLGEAIVRVDLHDPLDGGDFYGRKEEESVEVVTVHQEEAFEEVET